MKRFTLLSLLGLIFSVQSIASDFAVDDIRIEGLQQVDPAIVFRNFPINRGDQVDQRGLNEATKDLFESGYFDDVELLKDQGVLIVRVKERPSVALIRLEGNDLINTKIKAALSNNIQPVVCIGESEECFKDGKTNDFLKNQIITALSDVVDENQVVIAYEPIWAIGTGKTPTPKDINSIHEFIKDVVQSSSANNTEPKVLYGGSVTNENAESFFCEKSVDGALVGGASLSAKDFSAIINALEASI